MKCLRSYTNTMMGAEHFRLTTFKKLISGDIKILNPVDRSLVPGAVQAVLWLACDTYVHAAAAPHHACLCTITHIYFDIIWMCCVSVPARIPRLWP